MYYAPDAHMQVKELDYDSTGSVVATMDLLSYSVAGPQDSLPWLWIAVIAVVVVCAFVVMVVFLIRHFKDKLISK
jgi:hypothetical protein